MQDPRYFAGRLQPPDCVYEMYFNEIRIQQSLDSAIPQVQIIEHTVDPSSFETYAKQPGYYLVSWLDTTFKENAREQAWEPISQAAPHAFNVPLLKLYGDLIRDAQAQAQADPTVSPSLPRFRSFDTLLAGIRGRYSAPDPRTDNPFNLTKEELNALYDTPEFKVLVKHEVLPPKGTAPAVPDQPAPVVDTPQPQVTPSETRLDLVEKRIDAVQSSLAEILAHVRGLAHEPHHSPVVHTGHAEEPERDAEG